jgi:nucleoside-diphosphate-sugar epimerase
MATALVTGGTGFVGANLARRLVQDGHEVHMIVRPDRNTWRISSIAADVRWHHANLTDRERLEDVASEVQPEWVFHLAAHGAYSWQTDLDTMVEANIVGTMNLVRACLRTGFACFVNTGSSSEYGLKDHAPREEEWIEPASHYAITKAAGTLFCRHTARAENVVIPTLRLYSVYGPWEEPGRLVPSLLVQAMAGNWPPLARPAIARDFVFVDDAVDAFLLAVSRPHSDPGAVYNVGSGTQTTLRELVDIVQSILPVPADPVWGAMEDRAWDTTTWIANNRKIKEALGWQPRFNLVKGLKRTLGWLAEHPELATRYRGLHAH